MTRILRCLRGDEVKIVKVDGGVDDYVAVSLNGGFDDKVKPIWSWTETVSNQQLALA